MLEVNTLKLVRRFLTLGVLLIGLAVISTSRLTEQASGARCCESCISSEESCERNCYVQAGGDLANFGTGNNGPNFDLSVWGACWQTCDDRFTQCGSSCVFCGVGGGGGGTCGSFWRCGFDINDCYIDQFCTLS